MPARWATPCGLLTHPGEWYAPLGFVANTKKRPGRGDLAVGRVAMELKSPWWAHPFCAQDVGSGSDVQRGDLEEMPKNEFVVERAACAKSVFGRRTIKYKCPKCQADLFSEITDSLESDSCPDCGCQYFFAASVRGAVQMAIAADANADAEKARRAEERRQAIDEEKRKKAEEQRNKEQQRKEDAERPISLFSKLVDVLGWLVLGSMFCYNGGRFLVILSSGPDRRPLVDVVEFSVAYKLALIAGIFVAVLVCLASLVLGAMCLLSDEDAGSASLLFFASGFEIGGFLAGVFSRWHNESPAEQVILELIVAFVVSLAAGLSLCIYLSPSLVAVVRKHRNVLAIFVLNLGLGWTFLFWFAAMVWACTDSTRNQP
jgi:Zn-finger nucleic acid-binding protein